MFCVVVAAPLSVRVNRPCADDADPPGEYCTITVQLLPWLVTSPETPVGGSPHSTTKLFARNAPMTTATRWPGFTARVGFEKAMQYAMPAFSVLLWRSCPTFSI